MVLSFLLIFSFTGCKKNEQVSNSSETSSVSESSNEVSNESPQTEEKTSDTQSSENSSSKASNSEKKSSKPAPKVEKPSDKDTKVFEAYLKRVTSPEHPNNQKQPENLTKEEAEKWNKEKAEKIKEFEENALNEVAKEFNLSPEEVHKIYLKVWEYKLSQIPEAN